MTRNGGPSADDGDEFERIFSAPEPDAGPLDDLILSLRATPVDAAEGQRAAMAAFRKHHAGGGRRFAIPAWASRWTAVLGISGGILVAGGVAAAATGNVPHSVRSAVDQVFGTSTA